MQQLSKQPAFELGQIVATPGALAALKKAGQQPGEFLTRHVNREWGELSDEDRKENDYSLEHGFRLLSSYRTNAGDKVCIITQLGNQIRANVYNYITAGCAGPGPDWPMILSTVAWLRG